MAEFGDPSEVAVGEPRVDPAVFVFAGESVLVLCDSHLPCERYFAFFSLLVKLPLQFLDSTFCVFFP